MRPMGARTRPFAQWDMSTATSKRDGFCERVVRNASYALPPYRHRLRPARRHLDHDPDLADAEHVARLRQADLGCERPVAGRGTREMMEGARRMTEPPPAARAAQRLPQ